jgi:pimeloyl-ACP methyl ester carboxylesterase
MSSFNSFDGTEITYDDEGSGPLALLLHGFAANANANWHQPKVTETLVAAGRRVVAWDARGHGRSGKPHDPAAYKDGAMVRDARALIDHLGAEQVDVIGYSMGGHLTARVAISDPRVRSVVLGGVGEMVIKGRGVADAEGTASALTADDPATITSPVARAFRQFAESTGADREALAAVMRAGLGGRLEGTISVPALVIVGDKDVLVGPPQGLVDAIPGAELIIVQGDHLTAVGDPAFRNGIRDFLDKVSPR